MAYVRPRQWFLRVRARERTGRRGIRSLLACGLVASGLALVPGTANPVSGQAAEPVATNTSFATDCVGVAVGVRQPESNTAAFTTTAPASVEPGAEFTVRIAPQQSSFPDRKDSIIGPVEVYFLQNINMMFDLPTGADLVGATVVDGTGQGIEGTPTVTVDTTNYSPGRIVLSVPKVPKNPTAPTNATFFTLPAIELTLRATGAGGTNILSRVAGTNEETSGHRFQASSLAMADVRCWPQGQVQAPPLWRTTISAGSTTTTPTTTGLTADPTRLPAGNQVTLQATVNAPAGAVRFTDGSTILGLAELDTNGVATLTAPLTMVGDRSLVAHYLGTPGFATSSSAPVAVTVTDPAVRTPVQVTLTPTPAQVNLNTAALQGPTTVAVAVTPTGAATGVPTGAVRLYDGDTLLGTQVLSATGTASFPASLGQGGHRLRAEYVGDTDFFAATGAVPVSATHTNTAGSNTEHRALTGSVKLNDATGDVPAGSVLASSFRTGSGGDQTLDGTLLFPTQTLTVPGGTVTGQLAMIGLTDGAIDAGSDADANLDAKLYFQVHSADLGAGNQTFASTCAIGPFDVDMAGTRTGTDGALTLTDTRFAVPFATAGTCVNTTGDSLASAVGDAFAGANTELSLTLTPPAAARGTTVEPLVVTPDGTTALGQPVTLAATVLRTDGGDFAATDQGTIEFYDGDRLITTTGTQGGAGPTRTAQFTMPRGSTGFGEPPLDPLSVGDHDDLRARFVPNSQAKLTYATSLRSEPVSHRVGPAVDKTTPTVEVQAPETIPAGQPATLTIRLTPGPDEMTGPAPLTGTLQVFDDAAPGGPTQILVVPSLSDGGIIDVTATDDSDYAVKTALAPGEHQLRAVFTPSVPAAWWWTGAESEVETYTVTGTAIPTSLQIVSDSTRGTGLMPFHSTGAGARPHVTVQLTPAAVGSIGPFPTTRVWYERPDGTLGSGLVGSNGQSQISLTDPALRTLGTHSVRIFFDPAQAVANSVGRLGLGNQGFAPSEVTFTYEVMTAGSAGPMPTAVQQLSVFPWVPTQGTAWTELNAFVTNGATGSVAFTARNTATGESTALGSTPVSVSFTPTNGGRARLSNPAATAALPAGTYEISAAYTPSDPALFGPSATTQPLAVQVVEPGSLVSTSTQLSVTPAGRSVAGQPVILEVTASPTAVATGTVYVFDGETNVGQAPIVLGRAGFVTWDLAVGDHDLKVVFVPAPEVPGQAGSASEAVAHTVIPPAVETSTALSVSPEGSSDVGESVTLTATVDPDDAPGEVVFSEGSTELGRVPVTDGHAELVLDDLAAGDYETTARFVPTNAEEFAASQATPVAHSVVVPPADTTTALTVTPASPTTEGTALTLTAAVAPAEAAGTVEFLDGSAAIGSTAVTSGSATVVLDDPAVGAHSFTARFVPDDPALFLGSQSAVVDHTVEPTGEPEPPAMECRGADAATRALLEAILPSSGGVVRVDTPVTADVPDSVELGTPAPVSFDWGFVVPDDLANLAEQANAGLSFKDVDGGIVASGGTTARWAFPATASIDDLDEPISLVASGDVTATSRDAITYRVAPELAMTIAVAVPGAPINVPLACEVTDAVIAETAEVTMPGEEGIVATDADGNVIDDGALLRRGQTITVVAWPFGTEEDVEVVLNSTPRDLGTVAADVDGIVTYQFTVPRDLETGDHSLVFTGADKEHTFNFRLEDEPDPTNPPTNPGGGNNSGGGNGGGGFLPRTGAVILPLLAIGTGLVIAGTSALRARRRLRA